MADGSPALSVLFLNCYFLWNICYNFDVGVNIIESDKLVYNLYPNLGRTTNND